MMRLSSPTKQGLIRLCYLLPAITGIALAVWAFVPHLFFMYGDVLYETRSPFDLVCNTWTECQALLNGAEASPAAVSFSLVMSAVVIALWICVVIYATVALAAAICSTVAFSYRPTAREANQAKRWMQFFCANRVLYAIANLLILLPAAFSHILLAAYQKQMHYEMSLHFIGPSDLILAILALLLNLGAFLLLLRAQGEEHMDLFRLYKAK